MLVGHRAWACSRGPFASGLLGRSRPAPALGRAHRAVGHGMGRRPRAPSRPVLCRPRLGRVRALCALAARPRGSPRLQAGRVAQCLEEISFSFFLFAETS